MKYFFAIQLVLITWVNAFCQFTPFQDDDAIVRPCFNTKVIKEHRISKITMQYFTKLDGASIHDDGMVKQYLFDTAGKIIESACITKVNTDINDTVKCQYRYDSVGNIIIKRTKMGDFFDTWYYKWNKYHQVQTEAHVQETNAGYAVDDFKIATQKVISVDSFAYIVYPKQVQQYALNEDNKIFKKTITQYDDDKRFISRSCHYAVGWLYSQVDIDYDEKGNISGYENTGNLNGDMSQKTILKYDTLGRIDDEGIWSDGKQTHHIEYMYENNTGLISDKLDRDSDKALIAIIRFSYEYAEMR